MDVPPINDQTLQGIQSELKGRWILYETSVVAHDTKARVLKICLSDHYLVYCVRKLRGSVKHQHKYITSRQLKNFNQEAFLLDLSEVDWEALVANAQDIDDAVRKWTQLFALILEKHAPTLRRRVSDRYTPWLNADYFNLLKREIS